MSKLKQNLVTIIGAIVLSFVSIQPITRMYVKMFGPGAGGSSWGIGPDIPMELEGFSFAFPFFLTLLEFFFKKPLLERRPYLYIIGFFILISLIDEMFLLATLAVIIIGAIPGSLYHLIKSRSAVASPKSRS